MRLFAFSARCSSSIQLFGKCDQSCLRYCKSFFLVVRISLLRDPSNLLTTTPSSRVNQNLSSNRQQSTKRGGSAWLILSTPLFTYRSPSTSDRRATLSTTCTVNGLLALADNKSPLFLVLSLLHFTVTAIGILNPWVTTHSVNITTSGREN